MARTTRTLADGDPTVVAFNIFLRGPRHLHFNNDVPLDVALAGMTVIDPKHDPVIVRVTTEVLGSDPSGILDMLDGGA